MRGVPSVLRRMHGGLCARVYVCIVPRRGALVGRVVPRSSDRTVIHWSLRGGHVLIRSSRWAVLSGGRNGDVFSLLQVFPVFHKAPFRYSFGRASSCAALPREAGVDMASPSVDLASLGGAGGLINNTYIHAIGAIAARGDAGGDGRMSDIASGATNEALRCARAGAACDTSVSRRRSRGAARPSARR